MIVRICFFTENGKNQAEKIRERCPDILFERRKGGQSLDDFTRDCFEKRLPILFIGACGIAVRAICPYAKDKLFDSAVMVMDEKGKFIIPILSGHIGNANELAQKIAKKLGSTAVITTATDVQDTFSVDVFARKNGCYIQNREGIRLLSKKILEEGMIFLSVHPDIKMQKELPRQIRKASYPPDKEVDLLIDYDRTYQNKALLCLSPKQKVLGIGCKKGKSFEELLAFVKKEAGFDLEKELYGIASIDLKKEEKGLLTLAQYLHVPFFTFSAEELKRQAGNFHRSAFVEKTTGVSNVCERAAICLCGENGQLIKKKVASCGMTLAVAKKDAQIITWET